MRGRVSACGRAGVRVCMRADEAVLEDSGIVEERRELARTEQCQHKAVLARRSASTKQRCHKTALSQSSVDTTQGQRRSVFPKQCWHKAVVGTKECWHKAVLRQGRVGTKQCWYLPRSVGTKQCWQKQRRHEAELAQNSDGTKQCWGGATVLV